MTSPTFWEGSGIALLASIVGSIVYFAGCFLLTDGLAMRWVISLLALAYVLYLLSRSRQYVGRVTVMAACLLLGAGLWLIWPPLSLFFMLQAVAICIVRSLYFHTGVFSALADLALTLFSIACAFWALAQTGSLFISIWCFFLLQALFVFISNAKKPGLIQPSCLNNQYTDFNRAYQAAEAAVRKLSSRGEQL
jgi:hypothetical protein